MPVRSSIFGKFQPDDPDHPLILIAERYRKTTYRKLVKHGFRDENQMVVVYLELIKMELQSKLVESAHKTLEQFILWLERKKKLVKKTRH